MKTCRNLNCLLEFEPKHGNQNYCCADCRNEAEEQKRKKMIKRIAYYRRNRNTQKGE